jgi:type III pantothenate kinase
MKVLAIDCGNTRIKYTVADKGLGKVESMPLHESVPALAARWRAVLQPHGQPDSIVISNVAGDIVAGALAESLGVFGAQPHWVRSVPRQCGVVNRYDEPGKLGSDRWAAAIGAWNLEREACLVVNAGTATTVDALSQQGEFLGGLILPGLSMMRESLARGTADLPLVVAAGVEKKPRNMVEFPRNTADAIWNGCLAAQAGAIERMWRRLPESATCLLSGGAAQDLYPALNMPCLVVDNLVLEGLVHIAGER